MKTIRELIKKDIDNFDLDIKNFLINYSSIKPKEDDFILISTSGDRFWNKLPDQGKPIQLKLYKEFNQIIELVYSLICDGPDQYVRNFLEYKTNILECIEQSHLTWHINVNEAYLYVKKSLVNMLSLLENLYSSTDSNFLFVVDTSALIYNPDLESWYFDGVKQFSIAIPPTVISEIDSYENSNKNEIVKEKAKKLVRKFKEYSRRGNLSNGVSIVKDKINLFTIFKEPDMSKSLPHLNIQNNDDRIFASFIEVIRSNVNSFVLLVAHDFNLHNKANHYSLPVINPPENV